MATSSRTKRSSTNGAGRTAPDAGPFDLDRICQGAARVTCPLCHRPPAVPCTASGRRRGFHVARFGRAMGVEAINGRG